MRPLAVAAVLLAACSAPRSGNDEDAGPPRVDAGPVANGPLPAPLFRFKDIRDGTGYSVALSGVVTANGPASNVPDNLGVTPARELDFMANGGLQTLWYTLPNPFRLLVFPQDQIKLTYKEQVGTSNAPHSYGVVLRSLTTDALIMLAEDGAAGPAFAAGDRLNFDFAIDTQTGATLREPVDCGEKAHYPGYITQGSRMVHLFPGESSTFTVDGVDMNFTLLDMYRFENSSCGAAPEYSIAYIVQPKS